MMRKGIDVSNYQHRNGTRVDYQAVKNSGIDWCAVEIADGLHFINPYARADAEGFRSVGIETCAYFFGRPEQGDAVRQAKLFLTEANARGPWSKLILDVETGVPMSWGQIAQWVRDFESVCRFDFLYSNMYYWDGITDLLVWPRSMGWLARPSDTQHGNGAAVVQYGQGAVPGIVGPVDLNNVWYDRASAPSKEIKPMFDPPVQVVATVAASSGKGGWMLTPDGGVYTFGDAQFYGAPAGTDYWGTRKPALIRLSVHPGKVYDVVATDGAEYSYPT